MKDIKVMYSKKSDNWATPTDLYNCFNYLGFRDICPLNSDFNFFENESLFYFNKIYCNPPFSNISEFVDRLIYLHSNNLVKDVYILIPSRTDTKYYQKLLSYGCYIYFLRGRLHFNDSKNGAPFPTCVLRLMGHNLSTCVGCSVETFRSILVGRYEK